MNEGYHITLNPDVEQVDHTRHRLYDRFEARDGINEIKTMPSMKQQEIMLRS